MNYNIPLNIPKKSTYKYIFIYENEYDKLLRPVFDSGYYCTFTQFHKIYKLHNPNLSKSYVIKKCRCILKKLHELGFIEIKSINKHKFFYLKKNGRAIFTGNYLYTPKMNYKSDMKHDKFLISIMRIEYYINNNHAINNNNLKEQLYFITESIYNTILKYNLINYNVNDVKLILNSDHYDNIKKIVMNYDYDNILRIIWIDIYNIFRNLQLKNHTIKSIPEYLKIFIVGDEIKIHYAPNIYIYDLHDVKFYQKKLNSLFHNFFDITDNDTKNIHLNYTSSNTLGNNQKNHIGYALTLIGHNQISLMNKIALLNRDISINPHNPLIKNIDYIYIDISQYLNHASHNNNSLINADSYVENNILKLLNSL